MNVESVIPILVGVALALDGVWMMTGARFLLPIPRWNYPGNTAGLRVIGAGATIGGVGIAAGSGILAAYGPLSAGFYVVAVGVLGMTLGYGAAWWVNHRARVPFPADLRHVGIRSARASSAPRSMALDMTEDLPIRDMQLRSWAESMVFRERGQLRRLMRAILSIQARRPMTVPGYDEREPPAEGAAVPSRPKRPDPSLLAAAELALPSDPD